MINKPRPFKVLNIRIPIIIPIKGRGFINQGSGLSCRELTDLRHEWTTGSIDKTVNMYIGVILGDI